MVVLLADLGQRQGRRASLGTDAHISPNHPRPDASAAPILGEEPTHGCSLLLLKQMRTASDTTQDRARPGQSGVPSIWA